MGMNSWTAFHSSVTEADLLSVGEFFVSSGLRAKGYRFVNTDDGWDTNTRDNVTHRLQPDLSKFPDGISGLTKKLGAMNISFGIYSAASSVVCSGRPGSLFEERIDAQTFADWGVALVKYDSCGEYSYGNARFHAFADAVAATGKLMVISTEPFIINPNPNQARFSHFWRTGNDIGATWSTIVNRIDINDKWWRFSGPGHFNDPDMLQIGNGVLSLAEQRSHFALWAITKATLILGSNVPKLSKDQLDIIGNVDLIAINQDPLGAQAHKVAINAMLTPHFVGIAPCSMYEANATYPGGVPGPNGVTALGMTFHLRSLGATVSAAAGALLQPTYQLVANETGRCVGLRNYAITPPSGAAAVPGLIPALFACDASDKKQVWVFPTGVDRIGSIQNAWALANPPTSALDTEHSSTPPPGPATWPTALAVRNSTLWGTTHGQGSKADPQALLDGAYGEMRLGLVAYTPEPPCNNRNCQGYDPSQSWCVLCLCVVLSSPLSFEALSLSLSLTHTPSPFSLSLSLSLLRLTTRYVSPRSGTVRLAAVQGSGYRCYESGCYQLTSHLPAYDELCLARVASVSKLGVDPLSDSTGGVDVYAGPLAGGAFVFAIFNRGETSVSAQAKWAWAEIEGLGDDTVACTKELYSGVVRSGEKGGTTPWSVAAHDIVVLKVTPGSSTKC
jgi:hypothetical protein